MRFSVLASGSNGNAVYIEYGETKILLDAGISGKQLQMRLQAACAREMSDLTAILVTHEHDDHVRGLTQVCKRSHASIYMTEGTYASLPDKAKLDDESRFHAIREEQSFTVGDIQVTPFAISHDAEQPVAFRFDTPDASLAVVTDLGYVSDRQKALLQNCDAYVFESNHDTDMLRVSRYPWHLKRRILGDKGHLSNVDAGYALIDILPESPVEVYLAHLSADNNLPDLAELTVEQIVIDARPRLAEVLKLKRTSRQEATALTEISRARV
ncbi:metallo-hydrolase [Alicyclobacillus sacchari]|uniref:MBL fold metallo-hydrolase n=1 Tax=Alicyclobacillus sacchari TaxID=392010 RepID=UPI0023E9E842|nr:MBL fold metallo-hydrolase [Alicyclobacillus sacchari]GMA57350.1 metallo-hydrolase [Alicyclobacillus sacchari]